MKRNMKKWIEELRPAKTKKALPLLSFPCVSLLGVSVRALISDSDLQAKGMMAVTERTNAAASVSFMDLSVEAECFGAKISVSNDEVPTVVGRVVKDFEDAEKLQIPSVGCGRTRICLDTIRKASELISDRPIFAGIIGPFSLAARLFDVSEIMFSCYDEPETVHTVLKKATKFLIEYAKAFKASGADGIVMAEPVSGLLSPNLEAEFSAPYVRELVSAVQDEEFAVIYHNCGDNVPHMLESITSTGAMAYHFGNSVDIERDIILRLPESVTVMGNVDPVGVFRMGTPETVRSDTFALLERCEKYPNFVISSGCDIPPMTPWENIDAFFSAVDEFYNKRTDIAKK